jgi:hypothetical protein
VTDRAFEVQFPPQVFEIRDLRHVVAVRREAAAGDVCPTARRICMAGLTIIAAATAKIDWSRADDAAIAGLAVAGVIVSTMLICAIDGQRKRVRELWAVYQGRPVCLFRTTDPLVFGQVRRALLRAIERAGGAW